MSRRWKEQLPLLWDELISIEALSAILLLTNPQRCLFSELDSENKACYLSYFCFCFWILSKLISRLASQFQHSLKYPHPRWHFLLILSNESDFWVKAQKPGLSLFLSFSCPSWKHLFPIWIKVPRKCHSQAKDPLRLNSYLELCERFGMLELQSRISLDYL